LLLPWIAYTEELDIAANVMIPARAAISIIDIFFFIVLKNIENYITLTG